MEASQKILTLSSFSMHQCSIHLPRGTAFSDMHPQIQPSCQILEHCASLSRCLFFHEGHGHGPVLQPSTGALGTVTYCTASIVSVGLQVRCGPEASSLLIQSSLLWEPQIPSLCSKFSAFACIFT